MVRSALLVLLIATALQPTTAVGEFSFHHLHLNGAPGFLIDFYARLFDAKTMTRETIGGVDAIRAGETLLLITGGTYEKAMPNALWHFGWGEVSLAETYLAHARREVAWEPPLPADRLHLHLLSVTPSVAAAWYRDMLGARVNLSAAASQRADVLPPREHRMPEAIVWLGNFGILIYREEPPLFSSRGQRVDHLALASRDLDPALAALRARGVTILQEPATNGGLRSALVEGPDHLAIEIVESGER